MANGVKTISPEEILKRIAAARRPEELDFDGDGFLSLADADSLGEAPGHKCWSAVPGKHGAIFERRDCYLEKFRQLCPAPRRDANCARFSRELSDSIVLCDDSLQPSLVAEQRVEPFDFAEAARKLKDLRVAVELDADNAEARTMLAAALFHLASGDLRIAGGVRRATEGERRTWLVEAREQLIAAERLFDVPSDKNLPGSGDPVGQRLQCVVHRLLERVAEALIGLPFPEAEKRIFRVDANAARAHRAGAACFVPWLE